ncbi:MAG: hypothetical protein KGS72_25805 [Cyanobacteria bacterium REEB67]|nr:hypothetical protein [Cyanobacteria bacterium REEB67]
MPDCAQDLKKRQKLSKKFSRSIRENTPADYKYRFYAAGVSGAEAYCSGGAICSNLVADSAVGRLTLPFDLDCMHPVIKQAELYAFRRLDRNGQAEIFAIRNDVLLSGIDRIFELEAD